MNHLNGKNFENAPLHQVNWYVYRDKNIRDTMGTLWNGASGIKDKESMDGASIDQKTCKAVNVLFRNMENNGPLRTEFTNFTYDNRNDLYHAHVSSGKHTYVVIWESDVTALIINIVSITSHENIKYKRTHDKTSSIEKARAAQARDPKHIEYLRFDAARNAM